MNDRTVSMIAGANGNGPKGVVAPPIMQFRWQLDPNTTVGLALVAATRRLKGAGVRHPQTRQRGSFGVCAGLHSRSVVYASGAATDAAGARTVRGIG